MQSLCKIYATVTTWKNGKRTKNEKRNLGSGHSADLKREMAERPARARRLWNAQTMLANAW